MTASTPRVIRVFVSSTFRDLQAERDELVKRVFPRLHKLCESRGAVWGEVDLRWGITDEQAAEGQVLPICLEEIRRCRPYFIGMLGERYGWIPDEIDTELIEREPWLAEYRDRSVTELEIMYGVLSHPEMAEHSFFYLRDPAYVDSLAPERQEAFREGPTPEEIEEHGPERAQQHAVQRQQRLAALKKRIRESGLPVREYRSPQEAGELILADLTAVVDRLYPAGSEPDPLQQEAAEHEAFARGRAGVYIGRREYFECLDAHVQGGGGPLVVLGESGSGKSALLANWALAHRETHRDQAVVMHFIGSSPQSSDWAAMLRRVMGELARRFGIQGEIPDRAEDLRPAFANWLHMAAAQGRVVLILDALNQLEDREGAADLVWLPEQIPAQVRLVVSTLPGRSQDELARREWRLLEIEPLEVSERRELTSEYLAIYGKELDHPQAGQLAGARQCANPLFLRVVLEELRVWGEHETLEGRIEHYLAAPTIPDLYRLVLARWQADYERERPGLVGDAMSLLWAARRGLSEAELLNLLGSGGEPLPAAHWSPFQLAAGQSLGSRAGLFGFAHDYLRQAVRDAYLPDETDRKAAHMRLAGHFDQRREEARGVDELPWQLAEAGSWERLRDLLVDPDFFERAWNANEFDVKTYWGRVEDGSALRMLDAYRAAIAEPDSYDDEFQRALMTLLSHTGHDAEALPIGLGLVDRYRSRNDRKRLAWTLGQLGYWLEEPAQRLAAFREQGEIARSLRDPAQEANALIGQAALLIESDRLDDAEGLLERQAALARRSGDATQIHVGLGNRAVLHAKRKEFDAAEDLLLEKEKLAREMGDMAGLASALHNRATARADRGDPVSAIPLFEESAAIARALGDRPTLVGTLLNLAQASLLAGRTGEAEKAAREATEIAEGAGARREAEMGRRLLEEAHRLPEIVDISDEVDEGARGWLREHRHETTPAAEELSTLRSTYRELREATREDPDNVESLTALGVVCLGLDEPAEAEAALRRALENDDAFPGFEPIDSRVRQLAKRGGSFELPMSTRKAMCHLGFAYERLGKHKLAEDYVLDALFDCDDPSLSMTAGRFYLESSSPEPETAIAYFKRAIQRDPGCTAECDQMVKQFVATHRHLYPAPSWAVVEGALEIWESLNKAALE